MLTLETMGVLALAILWVNTLLVVGAAWGPLRDLLGRLRLLGSVLPGEVASEDTFAEHVVEQVGRRAGERSDSAVLFHDRAYRSIVHGGRVRAGGRDLTVDPMDGEVWVAREARELAAACPSEAVFDDAFAAARGAKGYPRTVTCAVEAGTAVWICGRIQGKRLVPPTAGKLVVATFDPRPWCRRAALLLVTFMLGTLLGASVITALALTAPVFGTVSTIGGVLGLVFFLFVQPLGVSVREAVLVPASAPLRGIWKGATAAGLVAVSSPKA
jgi:hypothetical protein